MTTRTQLRQIVDEWAATCEWPSCDILAFDSLGDGLQLAHIHGIGMGGRPSADTLGNVALLCRYHHDLLDGRTHAGLRYAVGNLLAAHLATGWRKTIETEVT